MTLSDAANDGYLRGYEAGKKLSLDRIVSLVADLAKYQACRVHDVDEKAYLSKRVTELEAALRAVVAGLPSGEVSVDLAALAAKALQRLAVREDK